MNNQLLSIIKNVLIEYVKQHNEYEGYILEFLNHLDEANEALSQLPDWAIKDLQELLIKKLFPNGFTFIPIPIV